jgi:hypothetical protein
LLITTPTTTPTNFVVYEDRSVGTFKTYSLTGAPSSELFLLLFGERDTQRGIFQQDPSNVNAVILTKVKTDDTALTVVIQASNFTVTPSPVDAGLTKFNLRTAAYDNFVIVSNLINGGPLAWTST